MHQPGAVIDYSRENAAEDSVVVEPVLDCVIRLGFPLALPPEAIPESIVRSPGATRTPNHDGLESAKPDLQSLFKKPGGDTAEP